MCSSHRIKKLKFLSHGAPLANGGAAEGWVGCAPPKIQNLTPCGVFSPRFLAFFSLFFGGCFCFPFCLSRLFCALLRASCVRSLPSVFLVACGLGVFVSDWQLLDQTRRRIRIKTRSRAFVWRGLHESSAIIDGDFLRHCSLIFFLLLLFVAFFVNYFKFAGQYGRSSQR